MAVIDPTTVIGSFFTEIVTHVTGSWYLALLAFFVFLVALALSFNIPVELLVIITFPFLLAAVIVSSSMVTVIGLFVFYLAVILARAFPFI